MPRPFMATQNSLPNGGESHYDVSKSAQSNSTIKLIAPTTSVIRLIAIVRNAIPDDWFIVGPQTVRAHGAAGVLIEDIHWRAVIIDP